MAPLVPVVEDCAVKSSELELVNGVDALGVAAVEFSPFRFSEDLDEDAKTGRQSLYPGWLA